MGRRQSCQGSCTGPTSANAALHAEMAIENRDVCFSTVDAQLFAKLEKPLGSPASATGDFITLTYLNLTIPSADE